MDKRFGTLVFSLCIVLTMASSLRAADFDSGDPKKRSNEGKQTFYRRYVRTVRNYSDDLKDWIFTSGPEKNRSGEANTTEKIVAAAFGKQSGNSSQENSDF